MSNLKTIFRQNAPLINDHLPPSKEIIYLRNVSTVNRKLKLITKNTAVLDLPVLPIIVENNNANTLKNTNETFKSLETCVSPFIISSDFELTVANNRIVNKFKTKSPVTFNNVANQALSKVIVGSQNNEPNATDLNYNGIIYFDYSEDVLLHQSIIIGITKAKVDRAIELNLSRTAKVLVVTEVSNDNTKLFDFSINEILNYAILDGEYYYLNVDIPNVTKNSTFKFTIGMDSTNTYFNTVTKNLSLKVTKNEISPYALYTLPPFTLGTTPFTREINASTLPSKSYGSKKYIQYKQVAGNDIIESYVSYTNNSGTVDWELLTPEFGTYNDNSFIIRRLVQVGSTIIIAYRIKNATLQVQFKVGLTSLETIYLNAFIINNRSYGTMQAEDYGVSTYANQTKVIEKTYYFGRDSFGIGEAVTVDGLPILTNNQDALNIDVETYIDNYSWGRAAIKSNRGSTIAANMHGNLTLMDGSIMTFPDYEYVTTNRYYLVERISKGIRIHEFFKNQDPITGYGGFIEVRLPMFTDTEALYLAAAPTTIISKKLIAGTDYDLSVPYDNMDPVSLAITTTTVPTDIGNI